MTSIWCCSSALIGQAPVWDVKLTSYVQRLRLRVLFQVSLISINTVTVHFKSPANEMHHVFAEPSCSVGRGIYLIISDTNTLLLLGALLSRILSILNLDWLQHARSVRGVYEVYIGLQNHGARFWYLFLNLDYVVKFPNWSVAGCHGNCIKNPASWFCSYYTHTSIIQVW